MHRATICTILTLFSLPAAATFSITACETSGSCGVAVATNNLAVGASVGYARADTGAIATQFETNPLHGQHGLDMLAKGRSPKEVLAALLAGDGNFEGLDIGYRQVAVVAPVGTAAVHSGKQVLASHWAGSRSGDTYAIAGNGLAGESVLLAMEEAFQRVQGDLPARLLAALEAGEAAGGQSTGAMSAALLVRTRAGGFADTDLRVDAAATAVAELRRLFGLRQAHGAMLAAESAARAGRSLEATRLIEEALRLGNSWDRIWRRAARTAMSIREPAAALEYLRGFRARNAAWWRLEIEDDLYAPLRDEPEMQRWRSGQAEP